MIIIICFKYFGSRQQKLSVNTTLQQNDASSFLIAEGEPPHVCLRYYVTLHPVNCEERNSHAPYCQQQRTHATPATMT